MVNRSKAKLPGQKPVTVTELHTAAASISGLFTDAGLSACVRRRVCVCARGPKKSKNVTVNLRQMLFSSSTKAITRVWSLNGFLHRNRVCFIYTILRTVSTGSLRYTVRSHCCYYTTLVLVDLLLQTVIQCITVSYKKRSQVISGIYKPDHRGNWL